MSNSIIRVSSDSIEKTTLISDTLNPQTTIVVPAFHDASRVVYLTSSVCYHLDFSLFNGVCSQALICMISVIVQGMHCLYSFHLIPIPYSFQHQYAK